MPTLVMTSTIYWPVLVHYTLSAPVPDSANVRRHKMRSLALSLLFALSVAQSQTMKSPKAESENLMKSALPLAERMLAEYGEFQQGKLDEVQEKAAAIAVNIALAVRRVHNKNLRSGDDDDEDDGQAPRRPYAA